MDTGLTYVLIRKFAVIMSTSETGKTIDEMAVEADASIIMGICISVIGRQVGETALATISKGKESAIWASGKKT